MRRALSQLCHGTSWLTQLGRDTCQSAIRSAGEVSTSYGSSFQDGPFLILARSLAAKAVAKGKGAAAPPPPESAARKPPAPLNTLASAGARLRRNRGGPDPLTSLTPQQRQLAEDLLQPSRPSPASEEGANLPPAAGDGDEDALAAAAAAAAGGAVEPVALRGLGQLGLALDRRDVASLLQQSLSGAAGQNVHFQPFVFSNVFQSAPAVASYVAAALENGTSWSRVERFFLAAVEADDIVRGVKVEVRGRIGRKADMASSKIWQWGELSRKIVSDPVDYGACPAHTRLGVLGVKVWIRYKKGVVPELFFPAKGGSHYRTPIPAGAAPTMSLDDLYGAAVARTTRIALPYRFTSVGWWEKTAAEQPAENRVTEMFTEDFDPAAGDRLTSYLQGRREASRRFRSAAERLSYVQTVGRFIAKQRRMGQLRKAALAAAEEAGAVRVSPAAAMGRRRNRALGRFRVASQRRRRSALGRPSMM